MEGQALSPRAVALRNAWAARAPDAVGTHCGAIVKMCEVLLLEWDHLKSRLNVAEAKIAVAARSSVELGERWTGASDERAELSQLYLSLRDARRRRLQASSSRAAIKAGLAAAQEQLQADIAAGEPLGIYASPASAVARSWHIQLARYDCVTVVDIADDTLVKARRAALALRLADALSWNDAPHLSFIVRHRRLTVRVNLAWSDGKWIMTTSPALAPPPSRPPEVAEMSIVSWLTESLLPALEASSLATWKPKGAT